MTAVLVRAPEGDAEVVDPLKVDGTRFRYAMFYSGDQSVAFADTAAELVAVLIGGYEAMSEEDRTRARVEYVLGLAPKVQALVLQSVDQTVLSEDEKRVLFQPRFEAITVDEWASEVPLVLVDVHYVPFNEVPAPRSALEDVAEPRNVVWLRGADDMALLMSLDRAGLVSLSENNDFVV